jgi:hypothetical protein
MAEDAIVAEELTYSYGDSVAVDHIQQSPISWYNTAL